MTESSEIQVVLVEDHKLIRELVKLSLKGPAAGGENIKVVAEAGDGVEALEIIGQFQPDVVVMDINMPRMGGIEATQALKQRTPAMRVVMLTASHEDEDIVRALSAGADGYCTKGVDSRQLVEAIKAVHAGSAWIDPTIARDVLRVWGRNSESEAANNASGGNGEEHGGSATPSPSEISSTVVAALKSCEGGVCSVDPGFLVKLKVSALSRLTLQ